MVLLCPPWVAMLAAQGRLSLRAGRGVEGELVVARTKAQGVDAWYVPEHGGCMTVGMCTHSATAAPFLATVLASAVKTTPSMVGRYSLNLLRIRGCPGMSIRRIILESWRIKPMLGCREVWLGRCSLYIIFVNRAVLPESSGPTRSTFLTLSFRDFLLRRYSVTSTARSIPTAAAMNVGSCQKGAAMAAVSGVASGERGGGAFSAADTCDGSIDNKVVCGW